MTNEFNDVVLFDDVTLGDILKETYTNITERSTEIDELASNIKELLNGNTDYAILGPVLNNFLDCGLKNNDQLLKFINSVQKLLAMTMDAKNSEDGLLTDEEKKQLMEGIEHEVRHYKAEKKN